MRKVAVKAGCTTTTLYHYFHNKRHILHYLWEEFLQQLSGFCMDAVKDVDDPVAKIQLLMKRYILYWLENPDHYRLIFMIEDLSSPPDEDLNVVEILNGLDAFRALVKAIESAVNNNLFIHDDVEKIWQVVFSHIQGVASCLITIREISWMTPGDLVDRSVETTLRGLLNVKPQ